MKPYLELRKELYGAEIDQKTIGKAIGRSEFYVSHCMTGKADWKIGEAYTILKLIGKGPEDIVEYFPPNGGVAKRK